MTTESLQTRAAQLVNREVHYCVSSLVSTLAQGYGAIFSDTRGTNEASRDLADLAEQALELASPIPDYEEAATEAGYEVRHDMHGYYACTAKEGEHEDAGNASVGFDGREHADTILEAWQIACVAAEVEPHEREVFEHWIVSDWLADKLEAKGEKVDRDFAGLTVWARTTTGQAISIDYVIEEIVKELDRA